LELHEAVDSTRDWTTFLNFARQLLADREDAVARERVTPPSPFDLCGANNWQNVTIEGFLEGAIAWAEDTNFGGTQGLSAENPWRQFAAFLQCGKVYE
jgi:hypothetical protein